MILLCGAGTIHTAILAVALAAYAQLHQPDELASCRYELVLLRPTLALLCLRHIGVLSLWLRVVCRVPAELQSDPQEAPSRSEHPAVEITLAC